MIAPQRACRKLMRAQFLRIGCGRATGKEHVERRACGVTMSVRVRTIRIVIAAVLLLSSAAPAVMAQSQDLGHKILGGLGLDAGTQSEPGVYIGDRVVVYRSGELRDRNGDRIPVEGLDIRARSNVAGLSKTVKLDGAYFSATV